MNTIVAGTSAWSRFFRDDIADTDRFVEALDRQIREHGAVTTGVVYLEVLRGSTRPETRDTLTGYFGAVPFLEPTRDDYAAAADLAITCRRHGVQLGTIDALIAQVCIANDATLLTADGDFTHAARHIPLDVWDPT